MSADDGSGTKPEPSPADRTLLGVAPPKLESSPDVGPRSPVFVRAGTAAGGSEEPLPLPRMALPSRPPATSAGAPPSEARGAVGVVDEPGASRASQKLRQLARAQPLWWMVIAPAFVASLGIALALAVAPPPKEAPAPLASGQPVGRAAPPAELPRAEPASVDWTALEGKAPASLSSREWLRLAEGRADRERAAAKALRTKLAEKAELAAGKETQSELLRSALDPETSREAFLALTELPGPLGPDLLYEAWTGTTARTDATELARALVYSPDVRAKASKALAVALDLRRAETCEEHREVLPRALTDGDRRSLHLLMKAQNRRGCGPKKAQDCYACLREDKDELTATINAVKSRRAPSYGAP
jgi:hypothetical protein